MSYTTEQLKQIARQKARDFGVNEDIFLRLIQKESSWNPRARSGVGAMGLVQLMPATAEGLGVRDPYDPVQSITGGARYLSQQLKRFGNYEKALAAYNAGPGNVERYGGIPPFKETQNYVKTILQGVAQPKAPPKVSETRQAAPTEQKGRSLLESFIDLMTMTGIPGLRERSSLPEVQMPDYSEGSFSPEAQELDLALGAYNSAQNQDKYNEALKEESQRQLQTNLMAAEKAKADLLAQALGSFTTPASTI